MRVLLAAAAVVALTVPTTLVVSSLNLSGANSDLSDAPAEVDGAGGDVPELPDVDASKSASPRAHNPSGTPSNSGTPSASSSGGAATSGGQGAGARKQGSGGAAP
ncbi:hypothetical protein ACWC9U_20880 [Streptomyces sp. 900116325]